MKRFYIVTQCLLAINVVSCFNAAEFQVYTPLAGKRCSSANELFERKVNSSLSCALVATGVAGCLGFSYHRDGGMCYGCDTFLDLTGNFPELTGTVFFRRLWTAPAGFFYVAGHLLRIVAYETVTYDQAGGACSAFEQLVRIDTPEMQTAIESFVTNPANGLAGSNYWIQCLLDSDGVYKYDDGTAINTIYWAPGEPSDPPRRCVNLSKNRNYLWADIQCDSKRGYICEVTGFP